MFFVDHYCSKNHWEYDFLYLPIDFGTDNNMGYAFVNFTSGQAASEISKVLKNFKWHGVKTPTGICSSRKICAVTWARIQGKEQLVKHFSCSNFLCGTDEYLPAVFSPPRNGASSLTEPKPIGKLALGPPISSSSPSANDD
ncbi:protein terminal ear1 homolog [Lycium barbarum]|uniref:protein terminal ear1 homolog n=1 Tax=Lycium barbarum TaxID=112863 RepID=UPI00293F6267|nr:protein terminal ear1 homolog [Lycium barbarum]